MNKCDILSLELYSSGRDIHIVEPVLVDLEKRYHLSVIRKSGFFPELSIIKHKPKLLLLSNGEGSYYKYIATKIASRLGVAVITFVSESAIGNDATFFWGYNTDRVVYSDLVLMWNQNLYEYAKMYVNIESLKRFKVVGATGFDRYCIGSFMDKVDFFSRYIKSYNTHYKGIIGIAGWAFSYYFIENALGHKLYYSKEDIEFYKSQRDLVMDAYHQLIVDNPDVLFLLKVHPECFDDDIHDSEFADLISLENTILIKNEICIEDCISVSDVWVGYESTTITEAWLLNKPTILYQPSEKPDPLPFSVGACICDSYNELKSLIFEYFSMGKIAKFDEKRGVRDLLLKELITHMDGNNHKRASRLIIRFLNSLSSKKVNVDTFIIKEFFLELFRIMVFRIERLLFPRRCMSQGARRELEYDINEREKIVQWYYDAIT